MGGWKEGRGKCSVSVFFLHTCCSIRVCVYVQNIAWERERKKMKAESNLTIREKCLLWRTTTVWNLRVHSRNRSKFLSFLSFSIFFLYSIDMFHVGFVDGPDAQHIWTLCFSFLWFFGILLSAYTRKLNFGPCNMLQLWIIVHTMGLLFFVCAVKISVNFDISDNFDENARSMLSPVAMQE